MNHLVIRGDARRLPLADASVHCCITSPPYFGLRDYGEPGQIGLEESPTRYVATMVEVFREVRRVLRPDGTAWLNLGDSFTAGGGSRNGLGSSGLKRNVRDEAARLRCCAENKVYRAGAMSTIKTGLGPKQLLMIPHRVAIALQEDGWIVRIDICWAKPNPMPESVTDRPTKSHEYLFLLVKSERYWYDGEAIKEKVLQPHGPPVETGQHKTYVLGHCNGKSGYLGSNQGQPFRNRRSVWTVATHPYPGAHFAVMPAALVELCVLAGCPMGGIILDPCVGSGTTGAVATGLGRRFVGLDLSARYCRMADRRIARPHAPVERTGRDEVLPLFAS